MPGGIIRNTSSVECRRCGRRMLSNLRRCPSEQCKAWQDWRANFAYFSDILEGIAQVVASMSNVAKGALILLPALIAVGGFWWWFDPSSISGLAKDVVFDVCKPDELSFVLKNTGTDDEFVERVWFDYSLSGRAGQFTPGEFEPAQDSQFDGDKGLIPPAIVIKDDFTKSKHGNSGIRRFTIKPKPPLAVFFSVEDTTQQSCKIWVTVGPASGKPHTVTGVCNCAG